VSARTRSRRRFNLIDANRILDALILRGRTALAAADHELAAGDRERLIGSGRLDVVLAGDFYVHAAVCVRHVVTSGHSLHILCEDGTLCSILSKLEAHAVHEPNSTATEGLHPHDED